MKPAAHFHDIVNIILLPILCAGCLFGLLGWVDTYHVSLAMMVYTLVDMAWVWLQPDCVPSLPNVILLHHAVTAILLCFPITYPELGIFTCWDGSTELNTFFLIARRQWRAQRRLFGWLYWSSFALLRMLLYPALLPIFYQRMQRYARWQQAVVCGAQVVLIIFNMVLLTLSVINWRRRSGRAPRYPSKLASSAAATACSVDKGKTPVELISEGKPGRAAAQRSKPTVTLRAHA